MSNKKKIKSIDNNSNFSSSSSSIISSISSSNSTINNNNNIILYDEYYNKLAHEFILSYLWNNTLKITNNYTKYNILETCLINLGGNIDSWLFTYKQTGEIKSKKKENLIWKNIYKLLYNKLLYFNHINDINKDDYEHNNNNNNNNGQTNSSGLTTSSNNNNNKDKNLIIADYLTENGIWKSISTLKDLEEISSIILQQKVLLLIFPDIILKHSLTLSNLTPTLSLFSGSSSNNNNNNNNNRNCSNNHRLLMITLQYSGPLLQFPNIKCYWVNSLSSITTTSSSSSSTTVTSNSSISSTTSSNNNLIPNKSRRYKKMSEDYIENLSKLIENKIKKKIIEIKICVLIASLPSSSSFISSSSSSSTLSSSTLSSSLSSTTSENIEELLLHHINYLKVKSTPLPTFSSLNSLSSFNIYPSSSSVSNSNSSSSTITLKEICNGDFCWIEKYFPKQLMEDEDVLEENIMEDARRAIYTRNNRILNNNNENDDEIDDKISIEEIIKRKEREKCVIENDNNIINNIDNNNNIEKNNKIETSLNYIKNSIQTSLDNYYDTNTISTNNNENISLTSSKKMLYGKKSKKILHRSIALARKESNLINMFNKELNHNHLNNYSEKNQNKIMKKMTFLWPKYLIKIWTEHYNKEEKKREEEDEYDDDDYDDKKSNNNRKKNNRNKNSLLKRPSLPYSTFSMLKEAEEIQSDDEEENEGRSNKENRENETITSSDIHSVSNSTYLTKNGRNSLTSSSSSSSLFCTPSFTEISQQNHEKWLGLSYSEVTVCEACYNIYHRLDKYRQEKLKENEKVNEKKENLNNNLNIEDKLKKKEEKLKQIDLINRLSQIKNKNNNNNTSISSSNTTVSSSNLTSTVELPSRILPPLPWQLNDRKSQQNYLNTIPSLEKKRNKLEENIKKHNSLYNLHEGEEGEDEDDDDNDINNNNDEEYLKKWNEIVNRPNIQTKLLKQEEEKLKKLKKLKENLKNNSKKYVKISKNHEYNDDKLLHEWQRELKQLKLQQNLNKKSKNLLENNQNLIDNHYLNEILLNNNEKLHEKNKKSLLTKGKFSSTSSLPIHSNHSILPSLSSTTGSNSTPSFSHPLSAPSSTYSNPSQSFDIGSLLDEASSTLPSKPFHASMSTVYYEHGDDEDEDEDDDDDDDEDEDEDTGHGWSPFALGEPI